MRQRKILPLAYIFNLPGVPVSGNMLPLTQQYPGILAGQGSCTYMHLLPVVILPQIWGTTQPHPLC